MAYTEPWTLEQAQTHLAAWIQADLSLASGESYRIGTRTLTRANGAEVTRQIAFWRSEIARLQDNRKPGIRAFRGVPRDL